MADWLIFCCYLPSFCFALQMRLCSISLEQKQKCVLELSIIVVLIDDNCFYYISINLYSLSISSVSKICLAVGYWCLMCALERDKLLSCVIC